LFDPEEIRGLFAKRIFQEHLPVLEGQGLWGNRVGIMQRRIPGMLLPEPGDEGLEVVGQPLLPLH
jgi:hypothetical protein